MKLKLLLLAVAIVFYACNHMTPLVVDDYVKFLYGSGRMATTDFLLPEFVDDRMRALAYTGPSALAALAHHLPLFYLAWGGRVLGEALACVFVLLPKTAFDVCNTGIYLLFLLLVSRCILGPGRQQSVLCVLFVHTALWLFLPAIGQDFFWISGATSYLWAMMPTVALLALLRCRMAAPHRGETSLRRYTAYGLLGLLAGWGNENISPGLLLLLGLALWDERRCFGRASREICVAAAGTLAGALLLWFAPGNFVRMASTGGGGKTTAVVLHDLGASFWALAQPETGLVLLLAIFVGLVYGRFCGTGDPRTRCASLACTAAALSAVAAYSVVTVLAARVFFGVIVLLIIACGLAWQDVLSRSKAARALRVTLAAACLAASSYTAIVACETIHAYHAIWQANRDTILAARAAGTQDVIVRPDPPGSRFCAAWGLIDHAPDDAASWLNRVSAWYYGVRSVRTPAQ